MGGRYFITHKNYVETGKCGLEVFDPNLTAKYYWSVLADMHTEPGRRELRCYSVIMTCFGLVSAELNLENQFHSQRSVRSRSERSAARFWSFGLLFSHIYY